MTYSQQQPLVARFSPYFLHNISDFLLTAREQVGNADTSFGLLFGAAAPGDLVIQSFRPIPVNPLPEASSTASQWMRAVGEWRVQSHTDSELSWLELVGWFCTRPENSRGLLAADVEFHNTEFSNPSHLSMILHVGPEERIWAELFSSCLDSRLHPQHHRRGSLYFSSQISPAAPVKVTIRERISDDAYLRTYQVVDALNRAELWAEWKERAQSLLSLEWLGFNRRDKDIEA